MLWISVYHKNNFKNASKSEIRNIKYAKYSKSYSHSWHRNLPTEDEKGSDQKIFALKQNSKKWRKIFFFLSKTTVYMTLFQ